MPSLFRLIAQIYIMQDGTRILNHTSIPLPDFEANSSMLAVGGR